MAALRKGGEEVPRCRCQVHQRRGKELCRAEHWYEEVVLYLTSQILAVRAGVDSSYPAVKKSPHTPISEHLQCWTPVPRQFLGVIQELA